MSRWVVTFSDGDVQFVWADSKRDARRQMKAYADCRGVDIVSID